jgi:hypothetical protein
MLTVNTDIKSVRLAWRAWTDVGARFPSNHSCFDATDKISNGLPLLPKMRPSAGIDSIRFEIGTMDIYHVSHRLGFSYMQESNSLRLVPPRSNYTSAELAVEKDGAVKEVGILRGFEVSPTACLTFKNLEVLLVLNCLIILETLYQCLFPPKYTLADFAI